MEPFIITETPKSLDIKVNVMSDAEFIPTIKDCMREINSKFYKIADGKKRGIAGNSSYASLGKNLQGMFLEYPEKKFKYKGVFGPDERSKVDTEKREEILDIIRSYGIPI